MYLTLEIPTHLSKVTLYDCFDLYTGYETMEKDNQYKLDGCGKYVDAKKRITIWRPPTVLIIELKRFIQTGTTTRKNTLLVDFPLKLNISKYVSGTVSSTYELCCVVNHMGSLHGGHYYSTCLNGNTWLTYNDSQVGPTPNTKLITPFAYLLFYKLQT